MCKCPEYKLHWDVFLFSILEMISVFYLMKTGKKYGFFDEGYSEKLMKEAGMGLKHFPSYALTHPV